jgi:hypothetical protein
MEEAFTDALVALWEFDRAVTTRLDLPGHAWRDHEIHDSLIAQAERADPRPPENRPAWARTEYANATRDQIARARWDAGELPKDCAWRVPFIHARTFVRAVAQIARALATLEAVAERPPEGARLAESAKGALGELVAALPHLKGVRDSVEHAEDRRRGLDRKRRPLPSKAIKTELFDLPGGVLHVHEALNGRRYGGMLDNGEYGEVEISDESIEAARVAIQTVFDALPWMEGPGGKVTPS